MISHIFLRPKILSGWGRNISNNSTNNSNNYCYNKYTIFIERNVLEAIKYYSSHAFYSYVLCKRPQSERNTKEKTHLSYCVRNARSQKATAKGFIDKYFFYWFECLFPKAFDWQSRKGVSIYQNKQFTSSESKTRICRFGLMFWIERIAFKPYYAFELLQ